MCKLCWKLTPSSVLTVILVLLTISLCLWLSPDWARENGPIEWTQAVILAVGGFVAVITYFNGTGSFASRQLFLCCVPVWLTLLGRELSWGRVFYPKTAGVGYLTLKELWFGPYVFPGVAAIFLLVLYYFVKKGLHKEIANWLENGRIPAIDGLVLVIAIITAHIAEHKLGGLLGPMHILLEELAETVVYFALLSLTINMGFHSEFQPGITQASRMKSAAARNL